MYKPSERWAFWFIRVQMNLSMRKVCGTPVSPQATEKQDKLHNITLQRLVVRIADGLDPKYIIDSDQFGMYLFPQARWMWVHKGDSEVKGSLTEDKSQYTGDIVHNDRGDVIAVQAIFAGKTNASLPHAKVREDPKFSHFLFSHTPNHWASLQTSLELTGRIWQWVVEEYKKDTEVKGEFITTQEAQQRAQCVWMLDCWPVNTSQTFREGVQKLGGGRIEIMYVPAEGTGRYQVNDTHMHKPMK